MTCATSAGAAVRTAPPIIRETYLYAQHQVIEGARLDGQFCAAYRAGWIMLLRSLRTVTSHVMDGQFTIRTRAGQCRWDNGGFFEIIDWKVTLFTDEHGSWRAQVCPSGAFEGTDSDGAITFRCLDLQSLTARSVRAGLAPIFDVHGRFDDHYVEIEPSQFVQPMHSRPDSIIRTSRADR